MSVAGWAVTIAGIPVVFTTSDMGALTCSSPLWFGGETGVTYANGWLVWPRGTITERAKPLEGELDVSPLSVELHDAATTAGGSPLLTGLAGKDSINVVSSPLPSSITAAATTITVGNGGLFTSPSFAWINGESVRITAIAGNVLTVTRGRLGTKAVAHTVSAGEGRFPEAFTSVPWTTRRKVLLWRVDAGTATLVWAGYAVRAPSLSDDGARYAINCDPLWSVQAQSPVGGALGSTRFVGYSDGGTQDRLSTPAVLLLVVVLNSGARRVFRASGSFRSLDSMLANIAASVSTDTAAAGQRVALHATRGSDYFSLAGDSTSPWTLYTTWMGTDTITTVAALRVTSRYSASVRVPNVPPCMIIPMSGSGRYSISSAATLPSSWSATTTTEASLTTSDQPVVVYALSDDWNVVFSDVTITDGTTASGLTLSGQTRWRPRKPSVQWNAETGNVTVRVANPGPMQVGYRVRTEHWALGLKHSVIALVEDAVASDWDWTSVYTGAAAGTVLRATAGLRVSREWLFTGKRTLGSVVTECCLLHGCTPVTRSGRVAIHAWGWPSAGETPVATLTAADIIGKPTWARWPDGVANRLTIKGDALTVAATLQQSRARYGPGRNVSVELAGIDEQALPVDDPIAFAREVVGRLELWGDPLAQATVMLKASLWPTLELGAVLSLTEWMLPDGAGDRGLTAALGVVVGRTLDMASATMRVDAILFPRRAYPYAPCAKVASVVSSTVVELATGYVGGTTSYSGVGDATTFAAGDVVELVERDTTTLWVEQLTVQSVDTGLGRITFTGAMSATAQAKIGAGWVDLRFADYAACQASQKSAWMFVADDTTAVIDGTADAQRVIAP